jgi:2-polyprenyl-3-methyl-5-hydroxy-6-metoxy-1,4-benzoquinol methylase
MRRTLTPELMDAPGLDAGAHVRALRGLARLNRLARSDAILWARVRSAALSRGGRASVLDIATGAGDVPVALARRAAREGITLELSACDVSRVAIEEARRRAADAGAPLDAWRHDAVWAPFPRRYDVVTCSLFLHHLDRESAVALLRNAADAAGSWLLVSDLRRSRMGLAAAWLASRAAARSRIVRVDAVKSVRAAFTVAEAAELAREAGLTGAEVRRRWPWRMLLAWRRV